MKQALFVVSVTVAAIALLALVAMPAFASERLRDLPKDVERLNGVPSGGRQDISVSSTSGHQSTAYGGGETVTVVNDGSTKVYCMPQTSSSGTVTTSNGFPLNPDDQRVWTLKSTQTHVACITASGTSTVSVFVME